jgi:hypothetical protein
MIARLWNLIVGQFCHHRWEIVRTGPRTSWDGGSGVYYDMQCKKCGNVKCKNT